MRNKLNSSTTKAYKIGHWRKQQKELFKYEFLTMP